MMADSYNKHAARHENENMCFVYMMHRWKKNEIYTA